MQPYNLDATRPWSPFSSTSIRFDNTSSDRNNGSVREEASKVSMGPATYDPPIASGGSVGTHSSSIFMPNTDRMKFLANYGQINKDVPPPTKYTLPDSFARGMNRTGKASCSSSFSSSGRRKAMLDDAEHYITRHEPYKQILGPACYPVPVAIRGRIQRDDQNFANTLTAISRRADRRGITASLTRRARSQGREIAASPPTQIGHGPRTAGRGAGPVGGVSSRRAQTAGATWCRQTLEERQEDIQAVRDLP